MPVFENHISRKQHSQFWEQDRSFNVLHIDDDKAFLDLSKIFLEQYGKGSIKVDTLSDPTKTLIKLRKETFDIILADYQMPEINGFELLKMIRKAGIDIPYIILSGSSREEDRIQALNVGVDYFLKKCDSIKGQASELVHLICKIIKQKQLEEIFFECEERFNSLIMKVKNTKSNKVIGFNNEIHQI